MTCSEHVELTCSEHVELTKWSGVSFNEHELLESNE